MLVVIDTKQPKIPTTCADCFLSEICEAYTTFIMDADLITTRIPDVQELPGCMIVCTLSGSIPKIPKDYLYECETDDSYVYRNAYTGQELQVSKLTGTILDDVTLEISGLTKQLKEEIMKDFDVRR